MHGQRLAQLILLLLGYSNVIKVELRFESASHKLFYVIFDLARAK